MHHSKSDSDVTSLAASSPPRSPPPPKRGGAVLYYVQSPSHDGDKFSVHTTSNFVSPMESPSHPSVGRHSRNSSSTRFSGIFRSLSGRRPPAGKAAAPPQPPNDKGWPECNVIMEEGNYEEYEEDKKFTRWCQAVIAAAAFLALFTVFCLVIWSAARPYEAEVSVGSLSVDNIYMGSGSDFTGVATKMLNINGTLKFAVYNPATFYGVHVTSSSIDLKYSDIVVATGQVRKYFQARKSWQNVEVQIEGTRVPLYGAGSSLEVRAGDAVRVPLRLEFEIRSRGDVVGKLVTTTHRRRVSCHLVIDSRNSKPIKFHRDSCTYA
ncbi:uncharacterized protein LOC127266489 [Andrographis paniculata]|uniref:uncharacterized protein LOC127266489 n=1 Tax=Andrographis paniculata TaxID=175694 RepID=UPI0021E8F22C|nr:uncharacterized protein LOC127266489 [Andrographis paniculata]